MEYLATVSKVPDVIFLDLNMLRKNGKECLRELCASKEFQNIQMVIFTTSLNPIDVQQKFMEGACFFMRKPNSFEELKEILHNLLYSQLHTEEQSRENLV